jgi:hypothetical protein
MFKDEGCKNGAAAAQSMLISFPFFRALGAAPGVRMLDVTA